MTKYIVEKQYLAPIYARQIIEAETPSKPPPSRDDADFEGSVVGYECGRATTISGVWEGHDPDAAHETPALYEEPASDCDRRLRTAARQLLAAFGGDTPDWLRTEATALADALEATAGAGSARSQRIVIVVEGGVIQSIISRGPVDVEVASIDYDVTPNDTGDRLPDCDGKGKWHPAGVALWRIEQDTSSDPNGWWKALDAALARHGSSAPAVDAGTDATGPVSTS